MRIVELHCDRCAAVRDFEQPPCVDGHGPDCDEWVCTGCGAAVVVPPFVARRQGRQQGRRGSTRRRAA